MKKLLLLTILFSFSLKTKAQVVFCPPGAVWHYNFLWLKWGPVSQSIYFNEEVKYVRDSIIDSQTVKVLKHTRFFTGNCTMTHANLTLIKQNGDTVFMRNFNTQNTWQILYNFSALAGHSWQNTFNGNLNYTIVVDSVATVTINNFNLKRLYVKYTSPTQVALIPATITERLGTDGYLFNYKTSSECDGPSSYNRNLCYNDMSFGLKQFSSVPCDYSSALYVGIAEKETRSPMKVYPNPVSDFLNIEINEINAENFELSLSDVHGSMLTRISVKRKEKVDLSHLKRGLYFISVSNGKEIIYKEKLIKE